MGLRGARTTLEERFAIAQRAQAGETDPAIAAAIGRSVWTIRKWRRRHQNPEQAGWASAMGRPPSGALGSFPPEIRETLRRLREEHPGWGPETLRLELKARYPESSRLPSRSRIAAFLRQEGLTRPYERRRPLPQPEAGPAQHPHEVWEVDAQGVVDLSSGHKVSIVNIVDVVSCWKVESAPCWQTSHPSRWDYQMALRRGFLRHGLPQRVSLDHDAVFYDNASASPFPTLLHLWLMALGVEVSFIQHPPPRDHSRVERTHQTIERQALSGQPLADEAAVRRSLDGRREFLNSQYPCRSLGGQPPLRAFPEARHSGRPYRLEWEAEMLDMQRVWDYLAQGCWVRRVSSQGQVALGGQSYYLGLSFAGQPVKITFDPQKQELVCCPEKGGSPVRLPIRGLTPADLMGELSPLRAVPVYQLALPLSVAEWRQLGLAEALTGTTF
ncbi:MAG: hypothetical protein N3B68_00690 [Anaerolineae bacterium]|nr:hypothetical protein [Anaerolineae bacterium]